MILTTLSFDGTHVIERCAECGAILTHDLRWVSRARVESDHAEFVRAHERCLQAAEQRESKAVQS